jgi:hypothetical protein
MTPALLRRPLLFATAVVLAASGLVAADPRETQSGAAPQTLDFVAIGTDGQPVTDLTAGQVSLKVGGKDRTLSALELVRFDVGAASVLPAPFATNASSDAGRSFLVVVDEETLRAGLDATVRDALVAFEKQISARDRIGMFTLPRGSTSLAPTTDRAQFQAAVTGLQGRAKSNLSTADRACHDRDVITALASILASTNSKGAPTPVIFVSAALAAPSSGPSSLPSSSDCVLTPNEFQKVGQAADLARAQFYIVRPEESTEAGLNEGLENLVGVASGQMLALGNAADGAFSRIARETADYYVATFPVENADRNGANHRVELRTTRPGVTVRTRNSIQIARATGGGAAKPQDLLRIAEVQRGFGMRALVVASRNDGDVKNTVKLLGLAEPTDPSVKLSAAAAGVYDAAGKLFAQWTAQPEELQRSPLAAALAVPTGNYRVRVAAVDTMGRAATVDYDITTSMVSAGVAEIGGLLIGGGTTGFIPQLEFSAETEAVVYFELYGRPTVGFDANIEIADSPTGPALATVKPTPAATAVPDKFMFTAKVPLASLKPGDYVVRAKLTFEGQPTAVLTRTIRKK